MMDGGWQIRLLFVAILFAAGVHVTPAQILRPVDIPESHLQAADYSAETYLPPRVVAGKSASPTARLDVRFSNNFPADARNAFLYAASIWEAYLESSVSIVVLASWEALPENTLGSAGPQLVGNFAPEAIENVWYPMALADAITGMDLYPEEADIRARFNSDFSGWYFGTDGSVPTGLHDFVSVVLHELGHGLGFTGSFTVDDGDAENGDKCPSAPAGSGCWGISTSTGALFPFVFDLFAQDSRSVSLLAPTTYPNPSAMLGDALQSEALFFDGPRTRDVPAILYAPRSFDAGSSLSHLDESTYDTPPGGPADPNALMTPFIARGEALHDPGPVTCAVFADLGWGLGAGCEAALAGTVDVAEAPLPNEATTLSPFHPNPAGGRATAVLTVGVPQSVVMSVYNAAGQRMDAPIRLEPGMRGPTEITLDMTGWPPGLYLVRLQGAQELVSQTVIHIGP